MAIGNAPLLGREARFFRPRQNMQECKRRYVLDVRSDWRGGSFIGQISVRCVEQCV